MINQLAKEIDIAIKNELYLVALNTALTLPDICGKAEYPELDNNKATRKRYIDWCNKYIDNLTQTNKNKTMPSLTANVIYSLRCSLSHQGNPNVELASIGLLLLYREMILGFILIFHLKLLMQME